ncbi:hypothetical protein D3C76_1215890 [compost metagenome]
MNLVATGPCAQFRSTFGHRQFGHQHLNIAGEQIAGFPAAQQQHVAGDLGRDVRVAVAVTAHPGRETHRHRFRRQAVIDGVFQLFVEFTQEGRHSFPQAVFHHRKAPLGFVNRGRTVFADLVGMPRLSHQLTQAAHDLVALVVGQIVMVELAEAGVHLYQFVDQGAAGDFRRVRSQHQLDRKLRHRILQLFGAELFVFQPGEQLSQRFRVAGGFTVG